MRAMKICLNKKVHIYYNILKNVLTSVDKI